MVALPIGAGAFCPITRAGALLRLPTAVWLIVLEAGSACFSPLAAPANPPDGWGMLASGETPDKVEPTPGCAAAGIVVDPMAVRPRAIASREDFRVVEGRDMAGSCVCCVTIHTLPVRCRAAPEGSLGFASVYRRLHAVHSRLHAAIASSRGDSEREMRAFAARGG
jgi:hypothetical protein